MFKTRLVLGVSLPLILLCLQHWAMASDRSWKRVDVFNGKGTVEIPADYIQIDKAQQEFFLEVYPSADVYFVEGLEQSLREELGRDRDDLYFPMQVGTEDSKAHIHIVEYAGLVADSLEKVACPAGENFVALDQGIHVVALSPDGKVNLCGGIVGAAAFWACPNDADRKLCVSGMNYVEFLKLEDRDDIDFEQLDPQSAWQLLSLSANGELIEHVLRSYKAND